MNIRIFCVGARRSRRGYLGGLIDPLWLLSVNTRGVSAGELVTMCAGCCRPPSGFLPYWSPGRYRHNHSFAPGMVRFQPMIGFVGGGCGVPARVMQRSPPLSTKQSTPPPETAQALMTRVPRHSTAETPRRGCHPCPGPTRALAAIRRPNLDRPRGLTLSTKVQCSRSPLRVNARLALADIAHQLWPSLLRSLIVVGVVRPDCGGCAPAAVVLGTVRTWLDALWSCRGASPRRACRGQETIPHQPDT